jgi:hypothetical protein
LHHLVDEALAFIADAVALRNPHTLKENLRSVGRAHAELVELARDRHALRFHRHADERLVAMFGTVAGIGEQAHPIRLRAVGDLPCPICKFKTTPHHDGRMHRSQKTKKPFTTEDLMERHLTKVG